MKIGDVYYEKHTVVSISKRTGTVSETDVEIVNVLPIDVLDKIRAEIADIYCGQYCETPLTAYAVREMALEIIDKYKSEIEPQESEGV